jgi:hypothetical protein
LHERKNEHVKVECGSGNKLGSPWVKNLNVDGITKSHSQLIENHQSEEIENFARFIIYQRQNNVTNLHEEREPKKYNHNGGNTAKEDVMVPEKVEFRKKEPFQPRRKPKLAITRVKSFIRQPYVYRKFSQEV